LKQHQTLIQSFSSALIQENAKPHAEKTSAVVTGSSIDGKDLEKEKVVQ